MTLAQTVDIPADRRVFIDVPHEIPTGKARVEYKIIPFPLKTEKPSNKKKLITRQELDELRKNSPTLHELSGILSHLGDVDLDEVRKARLARQL